MYRYLSVCFSLIVIFLSSGCTATSQNTYKIKQLKGQVSAIEQALSRQHLLIQQNSNQVNALVDSSNKIKMEVSQLKNRQLSMNAVANHKSPAYRKQDISKTYASVVSDKLNPAPSVTEVQEALRNAGFYSENIDGKAGNATQSAIVNFQKANGLESDGVVGNQTWIKLKKYL